jgi:hypothetical protein
MALTAQVDRTAGQGALARLDDAFDIVQGVLADVDPDCVSGEEAGLVLEHLVKLERAVAAGRLGYARRAAECMTWRRQGHRTAAHWLAQKTKTSVGEAMSVLETARRLPRLPATTEALRRGSLSVPQVREIADAATAVPSSEEDLIEMAGYLSLKGLQHRARLIKASAGDEAQRVAGIRKGRFLRHWLDPEGAFHLHARLTPDAGSEVMSAVRARANFVAEEAVKAGLPPESASAYEADALVALVTGDVRYDTFHGHTGGRRRTPDVVYHVSLEALRRGRLGSGELCEVPGVGPVPLAVIENVVGDAMGKLVISDGVDVTTVCHLGRTVPAHVETALEARDRTCVVPGCDVALSLEIDHWQVPFARGGPTALWNLARLCRFHHQLKTYEGYELRGGPGHWQWVPPSASPGPAPSSPGPAPPEDGSAPPGDGSAPPGDGP